MQKVGLRRTRADGAAQRPCLPVACSNVLLIPYHQGEGSKGPLSDGYAVARGLIIRGSGATPLKRVRAWSPLVRPSAPAWRIPQRRYAFAAVVWPMTPPPMNTRHLFWRARYAAQSLSASGTRLPTASFPDRVLQSAARR